MQNIPPGFRIGV
uniref:Uncharacterized protein n=1 Tax=Arundo donax TaxID=35708 RepID=A0A0A9A746_ARUDO